MPFTFDLASHPEADLLKAIVRANELYDGAAIAQRRGSAAYNQHIKGMCKEAVALDDKIANTRARTPETIRAKVEYALRDADPSKPSLGVGGLCATSISALWDVMAAGL